MIRKRRVPSENVTRQSLQGQLQAEIAARKSLQDFTETLAARVSELENMEIRRMVGESMEIDAQLARKNAVSMHGSSATANNNN